MDSKCFSYIYGILIFMNPTLLGNIFKLLAHFAKSTVLLERFETLTVVNPLLEIASLIIGISELSILNIRV